MACPVLLVREGINIKRAVVPDATFPALFGYSIMSGQEWNPELSLLIRGEGCDFRDFPGLPIRTLHDPY